jgi:hypothetical protein
MRTTLALVILFAAACTRPTPEGSPAPSGSGSTSSGSASTPASGPDVATTDAGTVITVAAPDAATTEPAASTSSCTRDEDCVLVSNVPPKCCSRCSPSAMTTAQAAAANAECKRIAAGTKDYFERCPHLSCTCQTNKARCRAGACNVETSPCR